MDLSKWNDLNASDVADDQSNESNEITWQENFSGAVRTTGRVKKPKIMFDPSEEYDSRSSSSPAVRKQAAIVNMKPRVDTCLKCGKSEPKVGSGHKSNFITCKTCLQKIHYACLSIKFETLSLVRRNFRCDNCRRCELCGSAKNSNDLIMCVGCADVYHLKCHMPALNQMNVTASGWKCQSCDAQLYVPKRERKKRNRSADSQATADKENVNLNVKIVQSWTIEQVASFIAKTYPVEANALKEMEIDGASLVLLTRQDVLTCFGLKLGPALRLYELILGLQSGRDDVTLAWHN